MSIRPHPSWSGWWIVDYYPEGRQGKRQREPFKGTYDEAVAYERRLRGTHVSLCRTHQNPPFREIAAEFLTWTRINNKSASYQYTVNACLKRLLPVFGLRPPSRITWQAIEAYKSTRNHVPVACNQEISILQIIINWGAHPSRSYCRKLPFTAEKLPVFRNLPQTPSAEDFDRLLEKIATNFRQANTPPLQRIHKIALLLIIWETGIRWIEARHLRWENLRSADGRLYLGRTKTGRARYTFVSGEVLHLLEPIRQPEGYIFVNPRTGQPYTTIYKSLHAAAKSIGLQLKGTHTLRHALGTAAMDVTGDLRGTQVVLGHQDIKSTTIYTHVAVQKIKQILSDVKTSRDTGKDRARLADTS